MKRAVWVLEVELPLGGWMDVPNDDDCIALTFPTLAAAIHYAERHGLDYRVIPPPPWPDGNEQTETLGRSAHRGGYPPVN